MFMIILVPYILGVSQVFLHIMQFEKILVHLLMCGTSTTSSSVLLWCGQTTFTCSSVTETANPCRYKHIVTLFFIHYETKVGFGCNQGLNGSKQE